MKKNKKIPQPLLSLSSLYNNRTRINAPEEFREVEYDGTVHPWLIQSKYL